MTKRFDVIAFHFLLGPHIGSNREEAQDMVDGYAVGTTVEVYYDPQDPAVSVLQPGASYTNIFGPCGQKSEPTVSHIDFRSGTPVDGTKSLPMT